MYSTSLAGLALVAIFGMANAVPMITPTPAPVTTPAAAALPQLTTFCNTYPVPPALNPAGPFGDTIYFDPILDCRTSRITTLANGVVTVARTTSTRPVWREERSQLGREGEVVIATAAASLATVVPGPLGAEKRAVGGPGWAQANHVDIGKDDDLSAAESIGRPPQSTAPELSNGDVVEEEKRQLVTEWCEPWPQCGQEAMESAMNVIGTTMTTAAPTLTMVYVSPSAAKPTSVADKGNGNGYIGHRDVPIVLDEQFEDPAYGPQSRNAPWPKDGPFHEHHDGGNESHMHSGESRMPPVVKVKRHMEWDQVDLPKRAFYHVCRYVYFLPIRNCLVASDICSTGPECYDWLRDLE